MQISNKKTDVKRNIIFLFQTSQLKHGKIREIEENV